MNKNYYLVIDTETVNGIVTVDKNGKEKLDLTQSLCYDIGWCICDKKGHIVKERSYVVLETFINYPDLMRSGYYADKLQRYYEDLNAGTRYILPIVKIWSNFLADLKKYDITAVCAYNMSFDYRSLNNTLRYITKSKYRTFIPKYVDIFCIMKMVNSFLPQRKSYRTFCFNNGLVTKHKTPRPQVKAETVYKYITPNQIDFIESHTGLEDAQIECKIMAYCFRQHKHLNKRLFEDREVIKRENSI